MLNPVNYVPRPTPVTVSRSTPISATSPEASGPRDTHTLLTLPERRRSRQPSPTSPLFAEHSPIDGSESIRTSIGLPQNQRRSLGVDSIPAETMGETEKEVSDVQRPESAHLPGPTPPPKFSPKNYDLEAELPPLPGQSLLGQTYGMSRDDQPVHPPRRSKSYRSLRPRQSTSSFHSMPMPYGTGSQPESRNGTMTGTRPNTTNGPANVANEQDQGEALAEELAWGPSHPCFPHLNSHVPFSSPEYQSTRIIRIRRDWMVRGDLAPTYSNLYPEILDPLLPEHEFRTVIHHINKTLVEAFDPYSWRNWLDGTLGLITGWLWEDSGLAAIKGSLKRLETWIEEWNERNGLREGVKVIPLRRTGYMNLDIQIPDPQLKVVGEDERSRPDTTTDVKSAGS